jgi:hypothetical protein
VWRRPEESRLGHKRIRKLKPVQTRRASIRMPVIPRAWSKACLPQVQTRFNLRVLVWSSSTISCGQSPTRESSSGVRLKSRPDAYVIFCKFFFFSSARPNGPMSRPNGQHSFSKLNLIMFPSRFRTLGL